MKRKFFITGGAGFLGSNFVHYILDKYRYDEVLVFDNLSWTGNTENLLGVEDNERFGFVQGDVGNPEDLKTYLTNEFTHVIHFAGEGTLGREVKDNHTLFYTNVIGTQNIAERLKTLGWGNAKGRKFLHISTTSVFENNSGKVNEESCYNALSLYSASKSASDLVVRSYRNNFGIPAIIVNSSRIFGPRQFPEKLVAKTIVNCLQGKSIPVYGDEILKNEWLHVDELNHALDLLLKQNIESGQFLAGGYGMYSNLEIVKSICSRMDKIQPEKAPHEKFIKFENPRTGEKSLSVDSDKLQTETGWKIIGNLEEKLAETIDWYLLNRPWWENIVLGKYRRT